MKPSVSKILLNIKGKEIPCTITYSSRARHLRIQVSSLKGLEAIVPRSINNDTVLKFIKDKEEWISEKLPAQRKEYLYKGNELEIVRKEDQNQKHYNFKISENVLTITGPFNTRVNLSFLYQEWLYLMARPYLIRRALHLAQHHHFKVNNITVRRQGTRWGSCSALGNISLNYKLLKHSEDIIDYVIFHELCHLIEMNHSKKFWDLLSGYVPNYVELRNKLKKIS